MGNLNGKSIRFSAEVDAKLEKIARKLGRTKITAFCQMVDYFFRTGKDPLDISDELLRKTLSRNHDAYTSFIKVQEKDLLIPIREESRRVAASQQQIVGFFNTHILQANKELLTKLNKQAEKFVELDSLVHMVYKRMDEKISLKKKFSWILDSYIQGREKVGAFDSSEKKRVLIEFAKQQLDEL